ncbi:hypothetical protein SAMN06297387_10758 [Streptomyces zhaozhouensis]|uniref:Uncharacterized protein n=1 Tax=Streptomyces zhaozhouensis TaxID=1300267 RepID=A0A286DVI6_9ACTN|nr:hypothetical protein [Streptomyces zhaozhouensis]SOD62685.1 hypothetical protein SAMN06297387_10758 [Streptomyces zhaozhouensis]
MEFAPAPAITAFHVRTLLDSPADDPVLYVDTKEAPRIEVWTSGDIRRATIVTTRRQVTGWIGEEPDDDAIHEILPRLQDIADTVVGGS